MLWLLSCPFLDQHLKLPEGMLKDHMIDWNYIHFCDVIGWSVLSSSVPNWRFPIFISILYENDSEKNIYVTQDYSLSNFCLMSLMDQTVFSCHSSVVCYVAEYQWLRNTDLDTISIPPALSLALFPPERLWSMLKTHLRPLLLTAAWST